MKSITNKLTKPKSSYIIISIPAYNEERDIGRTISDIKEALKDTSYNYKILVLDDGSKDHTAKIAEEQGAIVISHRRNKGLAETFRTEMKECLGRKADIIVHTDADGQYDPKHITQLIEKVREGYDLVLGSRFRGKRMQHMPFTKRFGNILFSKVLSSLTKVKITDSTTGYRAFTSEIAREIDFINTFTYTQEQIIKAAKQGFKITEIPINSRRTRKSRLFKSPLQYAIKAWINIFRIYRNYEPLQFFGKIGLAFFCLGAALGAWLVYRFIVLGVVGKLPTTVLSALLMLVGVQTILFGFLADMINDRKI